MSSPFQLLLSQSQANVSESSPAPAASVIVAVSASKSQLQAATPLELTTEQQALLDRARQMRLDIEARLARKTAEPVDPAFVKQRAERLVSVHHVSPALATKTATLESKCLGSRASALIGLGSTAVPPLTVTCTPEYSQVSCEPSILWNLIHIEQPESTPDALPYRTPIDLVCSIDRSASMRPSIDAVKQCLRFTAGRLSPSDHFAMVAFDKDSSTILPWTTMDAAGVQQAYNAIEGLTVGSGTNLCQSTLDALALIRNRQLDTKKEWNRVASVFLLGDGEPTAGLTSPDDIVKQVALCFNAAGNNHQVDQKERAESAASTSSTGLSRDMATIRVNGKQETSSTGLSRDMANIFFDSKRDTIKSKKRGRTAAATQASQEPQHVTTPVKRVKPSVVPVPNTLAIQPLKCSIYTFGFGWRHNAVLFQRLAAAGDAGGMYNFVDQSVPDKMGTAFAATLGGLTSVAAQNLRLHVSVYAPSRIDAVKSSWPHSNTEHVLNVALPDLQLGESRDILLGVALAKSLTDVSDVKLLDGQLSFTNLAVSPVVQCVCPIVPVTVERTLSDAKDPSSSIAVLVQRLRIEASEAMLAAQSCAARDQFKQARQILTRFMADRLKPALDRLEPLQSTELKAYQTVINLQTDVRACQNGLQDDSSYSTGGQHLITSMSSSHSYQRANLQTSEHSSAYTSHARSQEMHLFDAASEKQI